MIVNNKYLNPVNGITGSQVKPSGSKPVLGGSFGEILQESIDRSSTLKFSKHAEQRLSSRNINLSQTQKDRINLALKKAEEKGVKDSLVLIENMAFVVNVRSKTVITAVNSSELKENVFTNIDGAVIA